MISNKLLTFIAYQLEILLINVGVNIYENINIARWKMRGETDGKIEGKCYVDIIKTYE